MTTALEYKSFAIHQAWVSAYTVATASWIEFPLAAEGTLTLGISKAEVRDGEGSLDYVWHHTQTAAVRLRGKQTSLRILEMITGNASSSVAGGEQLYFGTDEELTPPLVRLKLIARAAWTNVSNEDTEGVFIVYVFKAKGGFPTLTLAETTPGEVAIDLDCMKSALNDLGVAVSEAFGRIFIAHSGAYV